MNEPAHTIQIRLARRTPSYWRVTFDNPPLNIFGPETTPELNEIVTALETDIKQKSLSSTARRPRARRAAKPPPRRREAR
jgi:hypothetical protein